jgi:hypothetical protein
MQIYQAFTEQYDTKLFVVRTSLWTMFIVWGSSPQSFQEFSGHLHILRVRNVTWNKVHFEDP